jgi:hypothetical protein
MKPNELRIGNWVLGRKNGEKISPIQVESIDDTGINLEISGGYYVGESEKDYDGYFDKPWFTGAIIEPIPLTEQWLIDLGFILRTWGKPDVWDQYGNTYAIGHMDTNYVLHRNWEKEPEWGMGLECTDSTDEVNYKSERFCWGIKYVHQLMNLYFSLTGTE